MLKKQLSLVLTFRQTTQAMAAEKFCQERKLPGRLIPVPREITAGCGLAWKAGPNDGEVLCTALKEAGIPWQEAHMMEV